ncbi:MAG: hypothetical protein QNJ38_20960 [Prochloraceae cyanobacterium]|nr:hypothetical protein [Prochloraceae cyanobacterium]
MNYLPACGKSAIDFTLFVAAIPLLFSPVAIASEATNKTKSIPISVPSPRQYRESLEEKSDRKQESIPIVVPQPENTAPLVRLPVPDLPIPKGDLTFENRDLGTKEEILYRVIVRSSDRELVRSLYPDAFQTTYNGETVLQVGLFSDRYNAIDAKESLQNLDLEAAIVD